MQVVFTFLLYHFLHETSELFFSRLRREIDYMAGHTSLYLEVLAVNEHMINHIMENFFYPKSLDISLRTMKCHWKNHKILINTNDSWLNRMAARKESALLLKLVYMYMWSDVQFGVYSVLMSSFFITVTVIRSYILAILFKIWYKIDMAIYTVFSWKIHGVLIWDLCENPAFYLHASVFNLLFFFYMKPKL